MPPSIYLYTFFQEPKDIHQEDISDMQSPLRNKRIAFKVDTACMMFKKVAHCLHELLTRDR